MCAVYNFRNAIILKYTKPSIRNILNATIEVILRVGIIIVFQIFYIETLYKFKYFSFSCVIGFLLKLPHDCNSIFNFTRNLLLLGYS